VIHGQWRVTESQILYGALVQVTVQATLITAQWVRGWRQLDAIVQSDHRFNRARGRSGVRYTGD